MKLGKGSWVIFVLYPIACVVKLTKINESSLDSKERSKWHDKYMKTKLHSLRNHHSCALSPYALYLSKIVGLLQPVSVLYLVQLRGELYIKLMRNRLTDQSNVLNQTFYLKLGFLWLYRRRQCFRQMRSWNFASLRWFDKICEWINQILKLTQSLKMEKSSAVRELTKLSSNSI